MLRKVYFYGNLGKKFGRVHEIDVSTFPELIRAFCSNYKEFSDFVKPGTYYVMIGDRVKGDNPDAEELKSYALGNKDVHIVPIVAGSKRGGLLKIILGVVLLGVGAFFAMGAAGFATAVPLFGGTLTAGNLAMMGLALTLAGAAQMLSSPEEKEKKDESFIFSGPGNNYDQGSPIPLIYGEVITGGVMVSGGIDIEDINKKPEPVPTPEQGNQVIDTSLPDSNGYA